MVDPLETKEAQTMKKPWEKNRAFALLLVLIFACSILVSNVVADEVRDDSAKRRRIEALYKDYQNDFPNVADISAERAMTPADPERILFVDVRKQAEQEVSMLPGAITDKEFLKKSGAYRDRLVIAYCTIGYRSGEFAQKLRKKGIPVLNLRGGILAWLHAGGKVYKQGKAVNRVHVYGKKWDLAPSAYKSIR
jgi:rhodanese-related sulfurtransferase